MASAFRVNKGNFIAGGDTTADLSMAQAFTTQTDGLSDKSAAIAFVNIQLLLFTKNGLQWYF